jgi:hypothetical protein
MNVVPPTMATWILKHLVLGERNEALEGDLLEEFQRRRSAPWYWRQVLGAMLLGFSNVLQAGCVTVGSVVFTVIWVCGLCTIASLTAHLSLQVALGNWVQHGKAIWIAEGIVFYLAVPLSVYLALARNLTLRAFTVGLAAGVVVVVFTGERWQAQAVEFPFYQPLNYLLEFVRAKNWNVTLWLRWYGILRGSVPLLAGIWAAKANKLDLEGLSKTFATAIKSVLLGSERQPPCK